MDKESFNPGLPDINPVFKLNINPLKKSHSGQALTRLCASLIYKLESGADCPDGKPLN